MIGGGGGGAGEGCGAVKCAGGGGGGGIYGKGRRGVRFRVRGRGRGRGAVPARREALRRRGFAPPWTGARSVDLMSVCMWLPVWWHARELHCPGTDPLWGGIGGTLQQFAWSEALQSFPFALQWTIVTMYSTHVTIYHHLISQAGWNRCNLSIYLSILGCARGCPGSTCVSPGDQCTTD